MERHLVDTANEYQAAAAGAGRIDSGLIGNLEDGLVLRELKTPEGQRQMIKIFTANKHAIRGALGGK